MPKANSINVKSVARITSHRGPGTGTGRHGPFTKEQARAIEVYLPDWHDYAFVKHPDAGGRGTSAILTKWKQDKAKEIMQLPEFIVLPDGLDYKETLEAIVRKFTNWRNAQKKQIQDRVVEIEAMKNAAAVLMDIKTYSKGRDLFKQHKHLEIVTRKTEILLSGEITSSVGAYQRAWKELWDSADQEEWEEMAQHEGTSQFVNQAQFPVAFLTALRGLTQGGLGNMEMLVLFAHREQRGRVISSLLEVHHNDAVGHFSNHGLGTDVEAIQLAYEAWCDQVIPPIEQDAGQTEDDSIKLTRDTSGLPLFPEINMDDETSTSVRKVLQVFFEANWEHSHPGDLCLPWDALTANPSDFYDDELYILDLPLTHPSNLSAIDVFKMASSLNRLPKPFAFRKDVSRCRKGTPEDCSEPVDDSSLHHAPDHASRKSAPGGCSEPVEDSSSYRAPDHTATSVATTAVAVEPELLSTPSQFVQKAPSMPRASPLETPLPGPGIANEHTQSGIRSLAHHLCSAPQSTPLPIQSPSTASIPTSSPSHVQSASLRIQSLLSPLHCDSLAVQPSTPLFQAVSPVSANPPSGSSQLNTQAPLLRIQSLLLSDTTPPQAVPSSVQPLSSAPVTAHAAHPSHQLIMKPPTPDAGNQLPPDVPTPSTAPHPPAIAASVIVHALAPSSHQLTMESPTLDAHNQLPPDVPSPSTPPRSSAIAHLSVPLLQLSPLSPPCSPSSEGEQPHRAQQNQNKNGGRGRLAPLRRVDAADAQANGKNTESKRPSRLRRAAGQHADHSTILPDGSIVTTRKRSFSDLTEKTEVVFTDGRCGTFEPSKKHKGGWFYQTVAQGQPAAGKEWMNHEELEENLVSSHSI